LLSNVVVIEIPEYASILILFFSCLQTVTNATEFVDFWEYRMTISGRRKHISKNFLVKTVLNIRFQPERQQYYISDFSQNFLKKLNIWLKMQGIFLF